MKKNSRDRRKQTRLDKGYFVGKNNVIFKRGGTTISRVSTIEGIDFTKVQTCGITFHFMDLPEFNDPKV